MNEPRAGFPQKHKVQPAVVSRKTAKNKQVPKSANYKSQAEGDWGKGKTN